MPRSPQRLSNVANNLVNPSEKANLAEDEARILESIKGKPELLDSLQQLFTGGRKKQQANWEELALQLQCNADVLKKVLLKARQKGETKKMKDSVGESRPRSARSVSNEPRETRRSVRLQSAASSVAAESTDNSCASSACGSPPSEASKLQQSQRSIRYNLGPISESETTTELDATAVATDSCSEQSSAPSAQPQAHQPEKEPMVVKTRASGRHPHRQQQHQQQQQQHQQQGEKEKEREKEAREQRRLQQQQEEDDEDSDNVTLILEQPAKQEHQPVAAAAPGNAAERSVSLTRSSASVLAKYTETAHHASDSKQQQQQAGGSSTRSGPRLSEPSQRGRRGSLSGTSGPQRRRGGPPANPEDGTRVFFESIGLTVMGFPQHVQATVKSQVSSIVHELEYELTSPSNSLPVDNKATVSVA